MSFGLWCIFITVLSTSIDCCLGACEGYSIKDVKLESCAGPKNLINVTNYKVELTPDCKIIPKGCLEFMKDIEKFSLEYDLSKNGIMLRQRKIKNGCSRMENATKELQFIFDTFNFVNKCPLRAGRICNNRGKSISIQKHSILLPAALGKISGKVAMKSDVGTACFDFELNLIFNGMQAGKAVVGKLPKLGK